MSNAKAEFINAINNSTVVAASIVFEDEKIILKQGYSTSEYESFLNLLDEDYSDDCAFMGITLDGIVWLENNAWMARTHDEHREWWSIRSLPSMPKEVLSDKLQAMNKNDILNGIELTSKLDEGYANSLRGPRTRGSITKNGLEDLPEDYIITLLEDQSLAMKGTAFFQGDHGNLNGKLGIMSLQQAVDVGLKVKARAGKHGTELYIDQEEAEMIPSKVITFIIATDGNTDGIEKGGLITWYPGEPTPNLDTRVAVKIHNG